MPLSAGTRLGAYDVIALVGAGGMGEVYRAHDTKLNRDVALKILPEPFALDADRHQRFQREAQLLASLNHPNIAAIHGLEEGDTIQALVLEFVEGPTLADRIAVGAIPLDEALPIARQIADALEAAHERGIIHRDLKPANIKLRPDGTVKVLDFGLARAIEDVSGHARPDVTMSPTITSPAMMTGVGLLLGTAAYMAPEQARGKVVDKRADMWAFGCVLYEMLTGRKAFEGDEVADVLARVLEREPDFGVLPKKTPSSIQRLVKRCLQKDRTLRLQAAGDARIEIQEALTAPAPVAEIPSSHRRPWLRKLWPGLAMLFLITSVALAAILISGRQTSTEARIARFSIAAPVNTTFDSGITLVIGYAGGNISPDGHRLAFTAKGASGTVTLWIRALDTLTAKPLPGTDGAALPFWAPDSRSVAFFAQGKLKKVDVEGGQPQTLCDAPTGVGGTWNRDGVIVFAASTNAALSRVSSAGGGAVPATRLASQQTGHRLPSFLPDGRHFLYFAVGAVGDAGVFLASLDSLDGQRLIAAESQAVYAPPGYVLFVRQETLLAQPFDIQRLQPTGDPTPIAEQVVSDGPGAAFSVSDNGVLTYRTGLAVTNVRLTWVDRNGKSTGFVGPSGPYLGPELSHEGGRVAIHRHDSGGGDVWLFDPSGDKRSRLTFNASQENSQPIWSSDDSHIVFGSRRNGKWGLYEKPSNGTGNEEVLVESDFQLAPMSWSTDGKFVVYNVSDPKTGRDVWALPMSGDRKPFPVLQTPFEESHPQISPDGKWIAYRSDETGRTEIYVQSISPGGGKWQVSSNGGTYPRWRRDGKELFYMETPSFGKMVVVEVDTVSRAEFSSPHALFDSGYANVSFGHSASGWNTFAVSADGQRFLIPRPEAPATTLADSPITVVLDWASGLKK